MSVWLYMQNSEVFVVLQIWISRSGLSQMCPHPYRTWTCQYVQISIQTILKRVEIKWYEIQIPLAGSPPPMENCRPKEDMHIQRRRALESVKLSMRTWAEYRLGGHHKWPGYLFAEVFPSEKVPEELPDLSTHNNCMAEFLRENPAVTHFEGSIRFSSDYMKKSE